MSDKDIRIAPSILDGDFTRLGEVVHTLERAGADWIHADIMDGVFVPNLSFGLPVVAALGRATSLPLDVHLMIQSPGLWVERFREAGADLITVHGEATIHLHRLVHQIRDTGAKAGVALNPATPLSLLDHVLEDIDLVLIMTVNPGYGGQSFIPSMIPKVEALASRILASGLKVDIQVDGGINGANSSRVAAAGARVLVAGSAIVKSPDPAQAIRSLRQGALEGISS